MYMITAFNVLGAVAPHLRKICKAVRIYRDPAFLDMRDSAHALDLVGAGYGRAGERCGIASAPDDSRHQQQVDVRAAAGEIEPSRAEFAGRMIGAFARVAAICWLMITRSAIELF
ncbi:hypothetical protein LB515_05075 [Mesorhizobium sp. CA15]|uniref:hypothetical protein n=1 Tax=unclassified Mesorhizobium TaxID=325217 RepID=UPI001CCF76F0|nr:MULTISPECIES: hypothetical protein [unclassified Mesorhizobium]MBZ9733665.1 hypothetical protein [Mesorhizobium sp. CA9]MBZ9765445.1 hypothetical protein [Mesorhizobium sp. CA6]MBZ9824330.1 hypothetical protein [Mesorhizobium sp. CA18]MBZ9831184.1 hypothetical protein [Mesorhizobium sp. CA2]MBZ9837348.1 hypothetical protein [Mesorhizobium sp. CA3]